MRQGVWEKVGIMKSKSWNQLVRVQEHLDCKSEIKISRKGVPHLVTEVINGMKYSVCYFKSTRCFTVFFPYAQDSHQTCIGLKTYLDVIEWLNIEIGAS